MVLPISLRSRSTTRAVRSGNARVARARLTEQRPVSYVPVDFEAGQCLPERLQANGFVVTRPAVVSWQGVTLYHTRTAIAATLETIGGLTPDTELIVGFMLPAECRDEAGEFYASQVAPTAAAGGETWLSFFTPSEIGELLPVRGFSEPTTVTQRDAINHGLWRRSDALRPARLSVLTHAIVGRPLTPGDLIGPAGSSGWRRRGNESTRTSHFGSTRVGTCALRDSPRAGVCLAARLGGADNRRRDDH